MADIINRIENSLPQFNPFLPIAIPFLIVLSATLLGMLIEVIVLGRVVRPATHLRWKGERIIAQALQLRIIFWSFLLGVFQALPFWGVNGDFLHINQILLVLFLFTLTLALATISDGLINGYAASEERPVLSIVTSIIRATIYIVGFLVILGVFQISVAPALAALGIGGLAVSLALQSTLTDVFSGVQIIAARQILPGNYVKLSTGEEGYITDINWRTTTIRQLANNIIIVPNSKMTSSIVINYHAPESALAILLDLGVSFSSDLELVERVTVEVAKEVMQTVEGGQPESEPFIRYNTIAPSSIRFTVILQGKEYTDQFLIKHEFIKRLHRRYQQEGIEIPFPVQTVYLKSGEVLNAVTAPQTVQTVPAIGSERE